MQKGPGVKRLLDLFFSFAALILLLPLFFVIAALIRLDSEGAVFFRQERVGRRGKVFRIWKFRTMVDNAEALGSQITGKNDPRVTQIGQVLRKLKLDELPQLINVLLGEMSFVGPRPEVPRMTAGYDEKVRDEIFEVLPGMLGSSQLVLRDEEALLPEKGDVEAFYREHILPGKIKTDLAYVRSRDPFKDLKILARAVPVLFGGSLKWSYIFESRRRVFFLSLDLVLAAATYAAAFHIRFENQVPEDQRAIMLAMLPWVICIRAFCYVSFGLYQTLWQYLGLEELISIIKAVTVGTLLIPVAGFLLQTGDQPRSTLVVDWLLLILVLGLSRVLFKITAERLRKPKIGSGRKNALIIGAGDAGEHLVREFIRRPELGYRPAGFLDEDPMKAGMRIHGIKVLGGFSHFGQAVRVKKIEAVVIAMPEVSGETIQSIIHETRRLGLVCRIMPRMANVLSPQIIPLQLKEVDIADLLGRSLVRADTQRLESFLSGRRVLITGAGGSIGSELARMVYQHHPAELVLVDQSESSLYDIETQLGGLSSPTRIFPYLRDVKDRASLKKIFETHRPEIVYHASAYKHVPLLETHFAEGIINNVLGTRNAADLSAEFGVERFVLISTDKAIHPRSVMGATKRICELYLQSLVAAKTKFMAVRFGNVFNSQGSVVPLFKRQIEQGGPVTVTHPDVKRYFMDISEAVFLILEASMLGEGSRIFVLDMGRPVKIVDLARSLMQLMGFSPDQIPIRYTGLRPGEKMEEEIEMKNEVLLPTGHEKIKIWKSGVTVDVSIGAKIEQLFEAVRSGAGREIVLEKIREIVPEYDPWRQG